MKLYTVRYTYEGYRDWVFVMAESGEKAIEMIKTIGSKSSEVTNVIAEAHNSCDGAIFFTNSYRIFKGKERLVYP